MPFGDCQLQCCLVNCTVCSEIIFGRVQDSFVRHKALIWHRSNSLDVPIVTPVLMQSHWSSPQSVDLSVCVSSALCSVCLSSPIPRWLSTGKAFRFNSRCARCHLSGYSYGHFACWLLVISSKVCLSTPLQLQFSASKCAPRCIHPAFTVRSLLVVGVCFDSGMVIPQLIVLAPRTTRLIWLQLHDSFVGSFANTFSCTCRSFLSTIVASSPCAIAAASHLYWWMCFTVLHSCTSSMVIVHGRGCCHYGTVIPLF